MRKKASQTGCVVYFEMLGGMERVLGAVSLRDLFQAAGRETRRRPWRFAACAAGYAIAVAGAMLLLCALVFSRHAETNILGSTGTHFIVYSPACSDVVASLTPTELAMLASGTKPARCAEKCKVCTGCNKKPLDLKNESFVAQQVDTKLLPLGMVDEVKREPDLFRGASAFLQYRFYDSDDGHRFTVGGFDPDDKIAVPPGVCNAGDVIEGAFLHAGDTGLALVEQGYAVGRGLRVGSMLTLSGWPFTVIGVVSSGVRPGKSDVYLTFADAEKVINRRIRSPLFQEMNVLLVEVSTAQKQDAALARMREILQSGLITTFACYQPAAQVLGLGNGMILAAAVLLGVLAASFGLKTQLASLRERRREIGILRSLGWSRSVVIGQLLMESALPGFAGGAAGAIFASLALPFVSLEYWTGVPAGIDFAMIPVIAAAGLVSALAGGLLAGLPAAWLAVGNPPADQLRNF